MKKVILLAVVMVVSALALMSFTKNGESTTNSKSLETVVESSDCVRIYVKWSDGSKSTNSKVSGDVCGGGVTDKVISNDGYADICPASGNSLCAVFIDGKEYNTESRYYLGKSYTIYKR